MFGTSFLFFAFFMAIGFLMVAMTISFALPTDFYKSLRNPEKGFYKDITSKDTKLLV